MKLTLRDLFWLVALVAMGCGWWVARREAIDSQREAVKLRKDNDWLREQIDDLDGEASEHGLEITEVLWPIPYFTLREKDDGPSEFRGGLPMLTR
jgi:hypothetical protein